MAFAAGLGEGNEFLWQILTSTIPGRWKSWTKALKEGRVLDKQQRPG